MKTERAAALAAIDALPDVVWVAALIAMRPVLEQLAADVMDDPTPEYRAMEAIDAECTRFGVSVPAPAVDRVVEALRQG